MLEGIDMSALEVKRFSGADLSPKYEPPNNPLVAPKKEVELKLYHGNCHCGSFKYSVKIPELKRATTCNCSICSRVRSSLSYSAHKLTGVERVYVARACLGRELDY